MRVRTYMRAMHKLTSVHNRVGAACGHILARMRPPLHGRGSPLAGAFFDALINPVAHADRLLELLRHQV